MKNVFNSTRPISRQEIAGYLVKVLEAVHSGLKLSRTEQEQLAFLQIEFKEELSECAHSTPDSSRNRIAYFKKLPVIDQIMPDIFYRNNRNFLSFEHDQFHCFIDPIFSREAMYATADTLSGREKVFQSTNGFTFRGNLGPYLGFYFDTRDTKEWGTRTYPTFHKITREGLGFVNGYGDHIYFDETIAYLVFKLPYFNLIYGKHENKWGPGLYGNLALSDYAAPYDQFKFQTQYWRFKFTSLVGFLRAYPEIRENGQIQSKSIAAHRLELSVTNHFQLGLHETVIYGGRKFEPAYLNPIMFYRSAEHALPNEDNATMGLDFDLSLIKNVKLYGEFLIDDITTTELGTGFYGNKLGYQAGCYYVNVATVKNLDLRVEYARLRPYVYSHKLPISTYQHFTTTLGHRIGPNSDDLMVQLKYRFSKALVTEVIFEQQRWGDNTESYNAGREITRDRAPEEPEYLDFLSGQLNRGVNLTGRIQYELFRNCNFGFCYQWSQLNRSAAETSVGVQQYRQEFAVSLAINID